eukprot:5836952-Pyramimonas_sp.AAC.1
MSECGGAPGGEGKGETSLSNIEARRRRLLKGPHRKRQRVAGPFCCACWWWSKQRSQVEFAEAVISYIAEDL